MNVSKRQQLLTILAVTVIALWAGDKLVVSPLTKSWKARAGRIAELRKSVNQGLQLLEREETIRTRWESFRTNTLPAKASLAQSQVLKDFDRWSQDSGISITSIKPQWKDADDYLTLECHVDAFGSLATLAKFLYNVEKDPLGLKVEAVEITTRSNDGQQLALALQVSGLLLTEAEQ